MISRKDAIKNAIDIDEEYYPFTVEKSIEEINKIYDSIGSCETCSFHGNLIGKDRTSEDMCSVFKTETHNSFYCKAYEEK